MLKSYLSILQLCDGLLIDRKWRNVLHKAETALRGSQLALSTAALPVRGSLLTYFARLSTTKIVNRLTRRNTKGSWKSTRTWKGKLANISDSIQIWPTIVSFVVLLTSKFIDLETQERSCQNLLFSWWESTLTRPPLTTSRETRRSRRRPSWVSLEALWDFLLASPSSVA